MGDDRSSLTRILGSIDEKEFFSGSWGRLPILLPAPRADRFDGLFGFEDLETYLFTVRPPAGNIRLVRGTDPPPRALVADLLTGRGYDLQAVYAALSDGYTIVLNGIHGRWPAASRLVRELEDRLLTRVQANVYVTGPASQGFDAHRDEHDVFVLQTAGAKRWTVDAHADTEGRTTPRLDVTLSRGDALYMPHGVRHAAATADSFSIHVTVGVFPMSWHGLARECLDEMAARDPRWRERVPRSALGSNSGDPTLSEIARRLRDGLAALPGLDGALDRHRHRLTASARRSNPPPDSYVESLRSLERLTPDTEVERRAGIGCAVDRAGAFATITFFGEALRAPASAERALRFIAATRRFRVGDIDPALSDASKLVLVRRLIKEGLLRTRPPARADSG